MSLSSEAYGRQLAQLLPPGRWKIEPGSCLSKLLLAFAEELARIDSRGEDLIREWDPRTAAECLEDWERVLGLPEPGQTLPAAVAARQVQIAAKLTARGGQTAAYYTGIAAQLGFVTTVTEIGPHAWRMDVFLLQSTGTDTDMLEAMLLRLKPAHTVLTFSLVTGAAWGIAGLTWGAFTWGH